MLIEFRPGPPTATQHKSRHTRNLSHSWKSGELPELLVRQILSRREAILPSIETNRLEASNRHQGTENNLILRVTHRTLHPPNGINCNGFAPSAAVCCDHSPGCDPADGSNTRSGKVNHAAPAWFTRVHSRRAGMDTTIGQTTTQTPIRESQQVCISRPQRTVTTEQTPGDYGGPTTLPSETCRPSRR